MNTAFPKMYLEDPVAVPGNLPMVQLATEVAMNLHNLEKEILPKYDLTLAQYRLLTDDPRYQMILQEQITEWSSPKNIRERIRLKSLMALEDGLLDVHDIVKNDSLAPQARIDAVKQLTALADAGPKRDEAKGSGGPGFSITINLGDTPEDAKAYGGEKDVTPPVVEVD